MNQTNDTILQAIDIVVNARLAQLHKDTTIKGIVIDNSDAKKGKYTIKYQNVPFDVYTDNLEADYKIDDSLYVTVPSGDMSSKKFILGRSNELDIAEQVDIVDPNQMYEKVGIPLENLLGTWDETTEKLNVAFQEEKGLPGYKGNKILVPEDNETSTYVDIWNVDENTKKDISPYREKYEFLQFSGVFSYQPTVPNTISAVGNYGLEFTFMSKDDKTTITYVFDTESMYGNPYIPYDNITRTVTVKLEEAHQLKYLQSIRLFSEGFSRAEKNSEITHLKEIKVKNIGISFAQQIEENENYVASIYTPFGVYLDQSLRKKIELHPQFRSLGQLISEKDYTVSWFERDNTIDKNSPLYEAIGGRCWKRISNDRILIFNDDINAIWLNKKIKLVIQYGKEIIREKEVQIYRTYNIASSYWIDYQKDYANIITLTVNTNMANEKLDDYTFKWIYTDTDGQWDAIDDENTLTDKSIKFSADGIQSNRIYSCCIYKGEFLIGILEYPIMFKVVEALFEVDFSTTNSGVFIYKENGYLALEEFDIGKKLGFNILWRGEEQAYTYQWLIPTDNKELDKSGYKNNGTNTLDKDYTPPNSMVTYVAGQSLEGNNTNVNQSIDYKISKAYNGYKTANSITLRIIVNDVKYDFPFHFTFIKQGDTGTNGTDYQMRIVKNNSNSSNLRWNNQWEVKTIDYKVEVYYNGSLLSNTNFDITKVYVIDDLKKNSLLRCDDKTPNVSFAGNIITVTMATTDTFSESKTYNILTVQVKPKKNNLQEIADSDYSLTYHLPIIINVKNKNTYDIFPIINYDASGYHPTYYQGDLNQLYADKSVKPTYSLLKTNTLFSLKSNDQNEYQLMVAAQYDRKKSFNVLKLAQGSNYIYIPLLAILNQYSMVHINDWDGNSIQINEKNGIIYAPQIAAGTKDNINNTFTGVVMGEYVVDENDNDEKTGLGLWGFDDGEQSFGFLKDGTAFLGKAGAARLEFNSGGTALIRSGNYDEIKKTGMQINLTDGTITAPGFKLTSDKTNKNKFEFILGDSSSSFSIKTADNYQLFLATGGNADTIETGVSSKYYLKSVNYGTKNQDGTSQGLLIDLQNGLLKSRNFSIDSSGDASFGGVLSAATGSFKGELTAATGIFTGTVQASVGDIGGWIIASDGLYSKNTTVKTVVVTMEEIIKNKTSDGYVISPRTYTDKDGKEFPGFVVLINDETYYWLTYDGVKNQYSYTIPTGTPSTYLKNDGNIQIAGSLTAMGDIDLNGIDIKSSTDNDSPGSIVLGTDIGGKTTLQLKAKQIGDDGKELASWTPGAFLVDAPQGLTLQTEQNIWISNGTAGTSIFMNKDSGELKLTAGTTHIYLKRGQPIEFSPALTATAVFGE